MLDLDQSLQLKGGRERESERERERKRRETKRKQTRRKRETRLFRRLRLPPEPACTKLDENRHDRANPKPYLNPKPCT